MDFLQGMNAIWIMVGAFGAAALAERLRPWRREVRFSLARWARAAGLNFYGIVAISLIPLLSGYGAAVAAKAQGFGLLNVVPVPYWSALLITVIVADALAFSQHYALHRWGWLWRLHRAHHSDSMIDASTALRFHPLETIFRAAIEAPVVFALGLPPEGMLLIFPVFLVVNLYTHWNVEVPAGLERAVSAILITPRMHRIHHTADAASQKHNYGTVLSIWDRLAGTRRGPDQLGENTRFGLETHEAPQREGFALLLMEPFRRAAPALTPEMTKARRVAAES